MSLFRVMAGTYLSVGVTLRRTSSRRSNGRAALERTEWELSQPRWLQLVRQRVKFGLCFEGDKQVKPGKLLKIYYQHYSTDDRKYHCTITILPFHHSPSAFDLIPRSRHLSNSLQAAPRLNLRLVCFLLLNSSVLSGTCRSRISISLIS